MPAVLAITAITITLTTVLALLPSLMRSPTLRESAELSLSDTQQYWYVVRSSRGIWYLNGESLEEPVLKRRLIQADPSAVEVRFLPSSARKAGLVAGDLDWLQQVSPRPVRLHFDGMLP